jgi:hypothetical protein
MGAPPSLILPLLAAPLASASAPAGPTEAGRAPVILFLVDNSASLPPLDPEEKRVAALEKMFGFLQGEQYRLILFGGRREVFVDDVARYRNNGQWTDLFFAFAQAREITREYPEKTSFRIILLTDAIVDPDPRDWPDVPAGEDLKAYNARRTIELAGEMKIPLYVILVGDPPKEGVVPGDREQSPGLVLDLVRAANGALAAPTAQSLASFFGDDGLLLKKFIFRVAPHEGLKKVEPVVKRIVATPRAGVELRVFFLAVFPLLGFLVLLLGVLVRSFPGPGDLEVVELSLGAPVHVGVDRLHRTADGHWATTGLCLVGEARDAAATLTYQPAHVEIGGAGLDDSGLDPLSRQLLRLDIDELRRALERYADEGTKEEKIFVLNLDYIAKNMNPSEAERLLTTPPTGRSRIAPAEFLRAKVHLVGNDALRRKLTEPRVHLVTYGRAAERKQLAPGAVCRIGRYRFLIKDVSRGGRKDARLVLYYDRVPSLLALKTILPDAFQRVFRMRRSSHRIVT